MTDPRAALADLRRVGLLNAGSASTDEIVRVLAERGVLLVTLPMLVHALGQNRPMLGSDEQIAAAIFAALSPETDHD